MNIVLDTDILISALIKDSITRKIIVESGWSFYYPKTSFYEIRKYKGLILEKSGLNEAEYEQLLSRLLNHILVVEDVKFNNEMEQAKKLIGKRDPDDVIFLATALSIPDSAIWSDDRDFEGQSKIEVLKTEDVVRLFLNKD